VKTIGKRIALLVPILVVTLMGNSSELPKLNSSRINTLDHL
jgi:hypothetical protein